MDWQLSQQHWLTHWLGPLRWFLCSSFFASHFWAQRAAQVLHLFCEPASPDNSLKPAPLRGAAYFRHQAVMANHRLWFGPVALFLFVAGTLAIGVITPNYSHVRQTVSELGEVGAPGQVAFSVLLCVIAASLVICATATARSLRSLGRSTLPAYFMGAMAISCAGVGIFAYPHPLHNVFGLSETIGLQAPLLAAITSRKDPRLKQVAAFSAVMYFAVMLSFAVNLIPVVRPAGLWPYIQPIFGIVQRSLFASWFIWCAGYAMLLMRCLASSSFDPASRRDTA